MAIDTTTDHLRQCFIEDMTARGRGPASQTSHLRAYNRFSAWLQRSPDMATADEVRQFLLHLAEAGLSIVTRNMTMTGIKFLFRVTLRRHDLAAEIFHLNEPEKVALILKVRLLLSLGYGAGLRAGEVLRLCPWPARRE